MNVPYVDIPGQHASIKEELMSAISDVLDHGRFILGQEVTEFEEQFAQLCQTKFAVGVNSGTDALIMALEVLGVGPGDEVISPPNSFVSSASCAALLGARPVFVDVDETYNIDPNLIEQAITPRTKAIVPVHLTGRPADMAPIMEIAQRHGLHVVEDCAQAVAAEYRGQTVGSFGIINCFSLHPLKTLNACGDGGVLTTNDPDLHKQLTTLRNVGLETRDDCSVWGHNSRLDTLQAAILLVKLKYLDDWTEKRRANAQIYRELLTGLEQVVVPSDPEDARAVYHTFVVQAKRRNELKDYLKDRGVGTNIHYPVPIHMARAAKDLGYEPGQFPVTERQANLILSLPVYPEMDTNKLEFVVENIRNFYGTAGN